MSCQYQLCQTSGLAHALRSRAKRVVNEVVGMAPTEIPRPPRPWEQVAAMAERVVSSATEAVADVTLTQRLSLLVDFPDDDDMRPSFTLTHESEVNVQIRC